MFCHFFAAGGLYLYSNLSSEKINIPSPNIILDIITTHLTAKIPYTLYVCICTANTYVFHPLLCLCQHHLYLVQKERFNIRPLSLFLPFFNIQSFSLWFRKVEHKKAETDNRERGQLIAIYLQNKFLSFVYLANVLLFISFYNLIGPLSGPVEKVEGKKAKTDNREKRGFQENILLRFLGQC